MMGERDREEALDKGAPGVENPFLFFQDEGC